MKARVIFRAVRPFVSALAVIATSAALVFTIYFTELGLQWVTFLGGVLVAAILSEATRVSRVEWLAARRSAQLSVIKDKLEHEKQLRKWAEDALAASKPRLHLIDEVLPTMVASSIPRGSASITIMHSWIGCICGRTRSTANTSGKSWAPMSIRKSRLRSASPWMDIMCNMRERRK